MEHTINPNLVLTPMPPEQAPIPVSNGITSGESLPLTGIDRMSVTIASVGAGTLALIGVSEGSLSWQSVAGVTVSTAVFEAAHILPGFVDRTKRGRMLNASLCINATTKAEAKKILEKSRVSEEPISQILRSKLRAFQELMANIRDDNTRLRAAQRQKTVPGEVLL